jgi:hypothetical protein
MDITRHLNFVVQNVSNWPEIERDSISGLTDEVLSQRSVGALSNWVAIPYVYFRRAGHDVTYSRKPLSGKINIASGLDLGIRQRSSDAYIVSCRADGHRPMLANHVLEQNGLNAGRSDVSWVHHPPQPGLIPRAIFRGAKIETVSYKGDISNLDESFRNQKFLDRLAERGMTLRIDERKMPPHDGMRMHDYSDIDVVLAVRNLTIKDSLIKPASKLINAWRGLAPAFLGPEHAFQELRRSELDYLEVSTPDEFFRGLQRLIDNPEIYLAMIENGRTRAVDHNDVSLVASWIKTLEATVLNDFMRWSERSRLYRLGFFGTRCVLEKLSKARSHRDRTRGPRVLRN